MKNNNKKLTEISTEGIVMELKNRYKKLTDTERIERLWWYIQSLAFNGEITMNRVDDGYEINFYWKDWSKNG